MRTRRHNKSGRDFLKAAGGTAAGLTFSTIAPSSVYAAGERINGGAIAPYILS